MKGPGGEVASAWERWAGWGIVGAVAVLVVLRSLVSSFSYTVWADRDLYRAWHVLRDLPVTGAELSQGSTSAIPGGLQYWLMAPVTRLTGDPAAVFQQALLQDAVGLLLMGALAWRVAGPVAAGLATGTIVLAPATIATHWRLWNPSFLPLFVMLAYVGAVELARDGRRRGAVVWAVGTGLGAQMHLQGGTVGLGLLAGAALVRPRDVVRQLPVVTGVLAALYAPFLLHELLEGAPFLRALLSQPAVQQLAEPALFGVGALEDVRSTGGFLVGTFEGMREVPSPGVLDLIRVPVAWLGVCALVLAPLAAVPAVRRRLGTDLAVLAPSAAAAWLTVGAILFDPQIHTTLPQNARYVVAAVPAVGLVGGVAAVRVGALLRGRPVLAILALGWVSVGLTWRGAEQVGRWHVEAVGLNGWPALRARMEGLEEVAGLPLTELAGRTLIGGVAGEGWSSVALDSVDFFLAKEGEEFPGSPPPPCYVLLVGARPDLTVEAGIARVGAHLGPALSEPRFEEIGRLSGGERVLRVEHEGMRCPTTLVDRYVLTSTEQVARKVGMTLEPGQAVVLPLEGGWRAVGRLREPAGSAFQAPLLVAVDLVPGAGGRGRVVLHAEALRGSSFNPGWLVSRLVEAPVVVLTGPQGEVRVPLADGLVGYETAASPLAVDDVELPARPLQVALELRTLPIPEGTMAVTDADRSGVPRFEARLELGTWSE